MEAYSVKSTGSIIWSKFKSTFTKGTNFIRIK